MSKIQNTCSFDFIVFYMCLLLFYDFDISKAGATLDKSTQQWTECLLRFCGPPNLKSIKSWSIVLRGEHMI